MMWKFRIANGRKKTPQEPTGKRGHPKWYDGKVDFANLDLSRCEEIEVDKGRLIGLKAYSKSLKRSIKVVVWYPDEEDTTKWQIYFSTDESMSTKDVIDCYCKHQYRQGRLGPEKINELLMCRKIYLSRYEKNRHCMRFL